MVAATTACACAAVMGVVGVRSSGERAAAPTHAPIAERVAPVHAGAAAHDSRLARPSATDAVAAEEAARMLEWRTPAGWKQLAPTSTRIVDLRTPGGAECWLSVLAGNGGGLAPNVNRWRSQMSVPALAADEIDALPEADFLQRRAKLLEVDGTWTGMGRSANAPGWSLVGLLLVMPTGSAFLKLVGPADVVCAERDAFLELARSFRPAGSASAPR